MPNIETGMVVETEKLGDFAKHIVEAKVLEGQCKGKFGWNADDTYESSLVDRMNQATWAKDYATVIVYATMLQARIYNRVGQQDPATDLVDPLPNPF